MLREMERRHSRLGLGRASTKAVIQRHDERIWAESTGKGCATSITVTLPLMPMR